MGKLAFAAALGLFLVGGAARADGCYLCEGGAYVKYKGADAWPLRHKAEACGCKVIGTASKCDGKRILCAVAAAGSVQAPATAQAPFQR